MSIEQRRLTDRLLPRLFLILAVGAGIFGAPERALLLLGFLAADFLFRYVLRGRLPEILNLNRAVMPSTVMAYAGVALLGPIFILVHLGVFLVSDDLLLEPDQRSRAEVVIPVISWLFGASLAALFMFGDETAIVPLWAGVVAFGGTIAQDFSAELLFRALLDTAGTVRRANLSSIVTVWLARYLAAGLGVAMTLYAIVWNGPAGLIMMAVLFAAMNIATSAAVRGVGAAVMAAAEDAADEEARSANMDGEAKRLHALAYIDALTGLANRRRFEADLAILSSEAVIILGDISGLKGVNDHRGHPAGDELLCAVARALAAIAQEYPGVTAYRFTGGDEYALLVSGAAMLEITSLLHHLEARVAREISTVPVLDGVRAWLRVGWTRRTLEETVLRARQRAEAMLTTQGIAERAAGRIGRA